MYFKFGKLKYIYNYFNFSLYIIIQSDRYFLIEELINFTL